MTWVRQKNFRHDTKSIICKRKKVINLTSNKKFLFCKRQCQELQTRGKYLQMMYLTETLYTEHVKNSQNSTVIKHRPQFKNGQKI